MSISKIQNKMMKHLLENSKKREEDSLLAKREMKKKEKAGIKEAEYLFANEEVSKKDDNNSEEVELSYLKIKGSKLSTERNKLSEDFRAEKPRFQEEENQAKKQISVIKEKISKETSKGDIDIDIDRDIDRDISPHNEKVNNHMIEKLKEGIEEMEGGNFVINTKKFFTIKEDCAKSMSNNMLNNLNSLRDSYSNKTFQVKGKQMMNNNKVSFFSCGDKKNSCKENTSNDNQINSPQRNYGKYDIQSLAYAISKDYSKIKIPDSTDQKFLERMKFYTIKRQIKEEKLNELIECQKPKINEKDKLEAFNRLIQDANRRNEAKKRVDITDDSVPEGNDSKDIQFSLLMLSPSRSKNSLSHSKMTLEKWNQIYKERFEDKLKKRNKSVELARQKNEKLKCENEEKIIQEIQKRTRIGSKEEVEQISKRLFHESEIRKAKLEYNSSKRSMKMKKKVNQTKPQEDDQYLDKIKSEFLSSSGNLAVPKYGSYKTSKETARHNPYQHVSARYNIIVNNQPQSPENSSQNNITKQCANLLQNDNKSKQVMEEIVPQKNLSELNSEMQNVNSNSEDIPQFLNMKTNDLKSYQAKENENSSKIKKCDKKLIGNYFYLKSNVRCVPEYLIDQCVKGLIVKKR